MRRRRDPEIIAGVINNDGSILKGDGFTCLLTGTGVFNLTFPLGFRVIGISTAVWQASTGFIIVGSQPSDRMVVVQTYLSTSVPASFIWSFVAVGVQQ